MSVVHVTGIAKETSDKDIRDFFSFCGKISDLKIEDSESSTAQRATVTFEKETAAKTALLLDNTQLGASQIHVTSASAPASGETKEGETEETDHSIPQEDKPRSRIFAEYLAHGYVLSDNAIEKALALDQQHGISSKFLNYLNSFDSKYKATEKAKAADEKYGLSQRANAAWGGIASYFDQAQSTPTGQKLRAFYEQGSKQVLDVHNEARHLANLKTKKTSTSPDGTAETSTSEKAEVASEKPAATS